MKVRVVIILNDYTKLGGVEKVTSNLASLFLKSNIPFYGIVSLNKKYDNPKIKYAKEVNIWVVELKNLKYFVKKNEISHVIIQSQLLKETSDIINEIKSDRVSVYPVLHSTPYAYLNWFLKVNNLVDFLKMIKMKFITKKRSIYFFKKIINASEAFLMVSSAAEKELKLILPNKYHEKIKYIYNPQSLEQVSDIGDYKSIKKEDIIVYLGRLVYEKQVLKTLILLTPVLKRNSTWRFEILGEGPEKVLIEKHIFENKLSNVIVRGRVDNISTYLKKSKISVLYSFFEGLPTSMLEGAFHYNVLVSSNSKGGISDIIKNDINGFIVESDSDFVNKIELLMLNNEKLEKLKEGNEIILANFDNTNILKLWEKILFK